MSGVPVMCGHDLMSGYRCTLEGYVWYASKLTGFNYCRCARHNSAAEWGAGYIRFESYDDVKAHIAMREL